MKKLVILMGLFMLIFQTSCESEKEEKKEHTAFKTRHNSGSLPVHRAPHTCKH
ncbi:hypothetical protein [Bizionia sp.]|uniref:hypothetical protein n=1 Tax=Bizionia sp. TaxID=1954480 RepID=UPI003A9539BF